ncbi:MAG: VWA domain-containing protein [Archangium sp.]|nr:VWA domain-containing protein [Archangium sp.]
MFSNIARAATAAFLVGLLLAACTNSYLYDERREDNLPKDRNLTLLGEFCTPSPNQVVRPIKILIAMDASQSMAATDPNGTRATAAIALLDNLPQEPEISFVVMLFAGSTTAWLSRSGLAEFDRVVDYTPADKVNLRQRILNFTAPGNMTNRDSTDFVKPLSDIYALLNRDIADARLMTMNDETRGRYSIIFLSDGQPTNNQDDELLCGDAVRRIRQLKDLADDVKVNTVHVFTPAQPIASSACDFDAGITVPVGTGGCAIPDLPPGSCPLLIVNQNSERLYRMSLLGGGDFRDFRNNEPINFLNFQFGQVRRNFVFDRLVVSNFSARAGSPDDGGDTDSDGLFDLDELDAGTLPWVTDTDTDGFSDGVEMFAISRNANFNPAQVALPDGGGLDFGCPPELRGVDSDCDGLTDCDEQIIGTNAQRMDSDDDGISDAVEFKLGAQASSKDLGQDPDNDRLDTGEELTMHMNPLLVDSDLLSVKGYRYEVVKSAGLDYQGRQCWKFTVTNVGLANTWADTRDAGNPDGGADLARRGAGFNDLFVTFSMKAGDDPTARTALRSFRHTTSRYPVGGIKSPHDGVIRIQPDDFVAGCATAVQSTP